MGNGLIDALRRYDNLLQIYDDLDEKEVGEIALQTVAAEIVENVDGFADYLKHRKNKADEIRAYIKDAQDALKRQEKATERIKSAVAYYITQSGEKSFRGARRCISVYETEKTQVEDIDKVPDKFKRQKISIDADADAIKAAIKNGEAVPGAYLETRKHIRIK